MTGITCFAPCPVLLSAGRLWCAPHTPEYAAKQVFRVQRRWAQTLQKCQAASGQADEGTPWRTALGFQCNERYLDWDESAARRLIKIYVAQKLDKSVEWVDEKLLELGTLIPDLGLKLDRMKADLVLQLVSDTPAVAARMLAFKRLLPGLNLLSVLGQYPYLLLDFDDARLAAQVEKLRAALPGVIVERVIEREPMLLVANVEAVLAELRRLLGPDSDPVQALVANPTMVLDMDAAGLPASLLIDDGIKP